MIETDYSDFSILSNYKIGQDRTNPLYLRQHARHIGASLNSNNQREWRIPQIPPNLLQLVIIVDLEILKLKVSDKVSALRPYRGGCNHHVDSGCDGIGWTLSGRVDTA
jgi:hypothetical protein